MKNVAMTFSMKNIEITNDKSFFVKLEYAYCENNEDGVFMVGTQFKTDDLPYKQFAFKVM